MKIIEGLRNYVLDEEFKIYVYKNKVNIVNYKTITHFNSQEIVIQYQDGEVVVGGDHLVVSKLLIDELLISGDVKKIELR